MHQFVLTEKPIDTAPWYQRLLDPSAGALSTFEGWVRNHNHDRAVTGLEYSAYTSLAGKEGSRILQEAEEKFSLCHAILIHRQGTLAVGEMAVWVGVSAAHRHSSFAACRYIIDEAKQRLPIWKRETYTDGVSDWVENP